MDMPLYNQCMKTGPPATGNPEAEIDRLIEQYRVTCLWFAPADYPKTNEQRLRALDYIERYGDREAFKRSRALRQWLLHSYKET